MEKLLVIGIDTLAGGNLGIVLADRCEVLGLCRQHRFELEGCRTLHVESHDADDLAQLVAAERPQWIVYCGPSSASTWEQRESFDAAAEAARAKAVESAAGEYGGRMTLVSTDAVFHGPRLFHRETFPTAEHIAAAVAARQVEEALKGNETLIVRTHLFGWSPRGDSFGEEMWTALTDGCPTEASGTRYATPILSSDAAELLWQAYRRKLSGLYHLGGAERVSQWQFAVAMATASGTTAKESNRKNTASAKSLSPNSEETSLDSRRLQRALSASLPRLHEGIGRLVEQAHSDYRQRVQGGDSTKMPELSAA